MKVTKDKVENSEAFLTIEAEPTEVEESLEKAYHSLVKRSNVPGFRKGKAPRPVLERHLGKERVFDEALDHLFPVVYKKAIDEQQLKAVAHPEVKVESKEPVVFKVTVPLVPSVELGDYRGIRIEEKPVELKDEQIDVAIDNLRHQRATWEPVERGVEYNDMIILDVESKIGEEPFLNRKGFQYQAMLDSKFPTTGFAEQLLGMKAGEEKEFTLAFPADYSVESMRGKEASYKVKTVEVKREVLPELNDDFAKQVDAKFETVDALKKEVTDSLKSQLEEKARQEYEEQTIDAAVAVSKVEFPHVMVEAEVDRIMREQMERNRMKPADFMEYLARANKTLESYHEELHPAAEKMLVRSLVLGKILDTEKIEVLDSDVDAEIGKVVSRLKEPKEAERLRMFLNSNGSRQQIRERLLTRKTVQYVVDIAKGSGVSVETKSEKEVKKND
ncbi:MAG: trigger factor [Chloroflexi bacterium]|nr:trigger factor [Chloroflexota bacterium]